MHLVNQPVIGGNVANDVSARKAGVPGLRLEIGRRPGERVIVIASSVGGALAASASTRPELSEDVAALVLVSPSYRVRGRSAGLLSEPWGEQIAHLMWGDERGFTPRNEAHARLWTTRYPTSAILPMLAITNMANEARVETITIPALFIYSPHDEVVDASVTARRAAHWGAQADSLEIERSGDLQNHVITGDALSPQTNAVVIGAIVAWLRGQSF